MPPAGWLRIVDLMIHVGTPFVSRAIARSRSVLAGRSEGAPQVQGTKRSIWGLHRRVPNRRVGRPRSPDQKRGMLRKGAIATHRIVPVLQDVRGELTGWCFSDEG